MHVRAHKDRRVKRDCLAKKEQKAIRVRQEQKAIRVRQGWRVLQAAQACGS